MDQHWGAGEAKGFTCKAKLLLCLRLDPLKLPGDALRDVVGCPTDPLVTGYHNVLALMTGHYNVLAPLTLL